MVTTDPMALLVRLGVLTLMFTAKIHNLALMSSPDLIGSFLLLSPVTIPQTVAVNENVFSVNLPGKIKVKTKKRSDLYFFLLLK